MSKIVRRLFAFLLTCWFVWTNIGVHTAPVGEEEESQDLLRQLQFLERRVHRGLGEDMQKIFPEGNVFTHALYGLGWCGYAQRIGISDTLREHALKEARWALAQIEKKEVQGLFPGAAELKFGVFYCGWRNYLLGSIIASGSADEDEHALFNAYSTELAKFFAASSSPFIESYPGMAWPADNVVAVASLAIHDRHAATRSPVIARWLEQVKLRLDQRGLVPHAWDPDRDEQWEHGRGCSQALINTLLPGIDQEFARQQFDLFREHFFMERLGIPLVREYPKGVVGMGDVDSGPVILGAGFAATIVGAGACRVNQDVLHAAEFDHTVEGFGLVTGTTDKRFLFGVLPIADLFIAWTRSMPTNEMAPAGLGFKRFHAWSLLAVILLWSPTWIGLFRRRLRSQDQRTAH